MRLLAPDILADACKLSIPATVTGLVLGLTLWAFGWRTHRFWVVLVLTVLAGIYGLYEAPTFRAQPVLASLLLALAAGILALALVRVLAFAAGGAAGVVLLHSFAAGWNQPLIVFLVSGLIAVLLFRFWMMVLTSFSGTLLMIYASLCLLNRSGTLDVVAWAENGTALFNWACGLLTLVGLGLQFLLNKKRGGKKEEQKKPTNPGDYGDFVLALPLWGWGPKAQKKAG
jgi:hypothetical protein